MWVLEAVDVNAGLAGYFGCLIWFKVEEQSAW
jgi:hypothetical protein